MDGRTTRKHNALQLLLLMEAYKTRWFGKRPLPFSRRKYEKASRILDIISRLFLIFLAASLSLETNANTMNWLRLGNSHERKRRPAKQRLQ